MVDKIIDINSRTYLSANTIARYLNNPFEFLRSKGEKFDDSLSFACTKNVADTINESVGKDVITFDESTQLFVSKSVDQEHAYFDEEALLKELCEIWTEHYPIGVEYATRSTFGHSESIRRAQVEYDRSGPDGLLVSIAMKEFVQRNLDWCLSSRHPYLKEWANLVKK